MLFPLSYCSRRKCQKRPRSWNSRHQFGNEGRNGKEIRERNRILSLRVWETGAGHQDEQNDSETITNKLNQNKINKKWVMTLSQIWHRLSCKSPQADRDMQLLYNYSISEKSFSYSKCGEVVNKFYNKMQSRTVIIWIQTILDPALPCDNLMLRSKCNKKFKWKDFNSQHDRISHPL